MDHYDTPCGYRDVHSYRDIPSMVLSITGILRIGVGYLSPSLLIGFLGKMKKRLR